MKKNDTIYTLQQNIEIPDIVTEKANMAFEQIRKDAGSSSDKIVTYQKSVKKSRKKYKYRSAGACRCRKDHTVGGTVICHRADPCAGACGSSGCISGYGCAGAGAWNYDFFQAGATSAK